jgi:hypothetical protein
VPNPFALIDRLDFDFDLPPAPTALERADHWFDRLSELQRIGAALMVMVFLAAAAFYCLGLGSTVLVNRAETEFAAQQAAFEAARPTTVPTVDVPPPTPVPLVTATSFPTPRPAAKPTQVVEYPTPIPPQFLPTVPVQGPGQRAAAPAETAPRPRVVAPYEPPTPTPPVRQAAPAKPGTAGSGTTAPATSGGTPARATTPTPALGVPSIIRTQPPGANGTRPPGTAAPAAKPTTGTAPSGGSTLPSSGQATPAAKPTSAPIIQNPLFPTTPAAKPNTATTPAAKPGPTR